MFCLWLNPLPDDKVLTLPNRKIADDIFKFNENSRKLSKRVENTVGKGEIARHEQFLLYPQCFQKAYQGRLLVALLFRRLNTTEAELYVGMISGALTFHLHDVTTAYFPTFHLKQHNFSKLALSTP